MSKKGIKKFKCRESVWRGYHTTRCHFNATKDGYCGIHHPDAVAARKEKSHERYKARERASCHYKLREVLEENKKLRKRIKRLKRRLE